MSKTQKRMLKKEFTENAERLDFPGVDSVDSNQVPFAELVYENSLHPVQVKICTPSDPQKTRMVDKLLTELQCEV